MSKKTKAITCLVFAATAALCGLVILAVLDHRPDYTPSSKAETVQSGGMPVSVLAVEAKAAPATVTALGEVNPLWQATLKSQVDGRIVFLSKPLQPGNRVKNGDLLVQIEKSHFKMQVAEAESRLEAAKVSLLKEQREAGEARKNWERSGLAGEPSSPLVLREPQLAAAHSNVKAARAALEYAKTLLGHTDIRAPFDGVITQRHVNPGETLLAGDMLVSLYSLETAEVGIQLDADQWALLSEPVEGAEALLADPRRQASWKGRVVRESLRLGHDSRLRTLFIQVDHPLEQTPPLLPGSFIRAEITGRNVPGLLCIPESALTKQGLAWRVDEGGLLRSFRADPVFYGAGKVYVRTPEGVESPLRIAVSPNSSFTGGLHVQIVRSVENKEQ